VSTQVDALRAYGAARAQPADHFGFAWAPRNASGMPAAGFVAATGAILDRLAAAIRDSGEPGAGACGASGEWCGGEIPGGWLNDAWQTFSSWGVPAVRFTSPAQSLTAGRPSAAMSVQLQLAGAPYQAGADTSVTLRSTSPGGAFAASSQGPWSSSLTVTIGQGWTAAGPFFYRDTRAGSATVTATAPGATAGTQPETVAPGAIARLFVTPATATLAPGQSQTFFATGADAYGNQVSTAAAGWVVRPARAGSAVPATGPWATFTAQVAGTARIVARVAGRRVLAAHAVVTVPDG
jgi:hypothetical protein